ncbi:MAG: winged helix-turn-helix transcriptional regulator [Asgard group archaeon]|nr:winged helix-turn-helix transcriptional regulator [Asgard group archaeon]
MTIEERDLELLIALQEKPLAPASKLAKAINLSTPTVITRLDLLKNGKSYYNVFAHLLPETLELEIVDVLIEINNIEDVEYFEQHVCYNHPYTLFRIRCFGSFNGLYVQFRIPKNSQPLLITMLEELKKRKRIQSFLIPKIIPEAKTIYTKSNLANWEANLMRWNFDWDGWLKKLQKIDSNRIFVEKEESILPKLDELDIALLQEISTSARRKNTEIMDSLQLNKTEVGLQQKISRKLKFLDKEVVSQYRVFLRWETFEIYNSFYVICECEDSTANKLQNLLIKDPIPFESTFKITEKGYIWYIRCPASHFSNIATIIWQSSSKAHFYYLDYKKSEFYGLWKGAFDSTQHNWSTKLMKTEQVLQ